MSLKMKTAEKLNIVRGQPRLRKMWYTYITLVSINIILVLINLSNHYFSSLKDADNSEKLIFAILALLVLTWLIIVLIGAYRLSRWVGIFYILGLLEAIGNFNILAIIFTGLVIYFYYYISNKVELLGNTPVTSKS